ncbi:L-seryl-tRNA(Sec) selenium transferase [candidate division WOR-3 bacterium]|uniref:L-seryl-tRNA(Sec) selenium transferase n=1 Tax=candidate division WOR-3 bacterium TaxID=2052148 RepID=A0A660SCB7_UNCW3|nr:MAG: L-seryl-tRNA(Sec) selenium transferase [candidate division WOR-3 bacterium]
MASTELRKIPRVDELLSLPALADLPHPLAKMVINRVLDQARKQGKIDPDQIRARIGELAEEYRYPYVRRAVNGLGVVLHTGLGRAPLYHAAEMIHQAMTGFSALQIDFDTGRRGDRYQRIDDLLRTITGCESSVIVNNNAAATMLILNTFGQGKEIIVSRGQLVEIGGAFRIPDVMKRSGARLVEVGTTNRTHLRDYEEAITDQTAAIMRVHQSNYRIIGFTKDVPLEELVSLAHRHNLLMIDDLGSGAFFDLRQYGLPYEPFVQESIKLGADLICFSGDKLLCGPQCGIILGKKALIDRIKKNPLTRALRCCKFTFIALEATLRLFLDPEHLIRTHPVLKLLTLDPKRIRRRAKLFLGKVRKLFPGLKVDLVETRSEIGGGSLAGHDLLSYAVAITPPINPDRFARRMRKQPVPVMGRVEGDRYLLDFRTILPKEERFIIEALRRVLA